MTICPRHGVTYVATHAMPYCPICGPDAPAPIVPCAAMTTHTPPPDLGIPALVIPCQCLRGHAGDHVGIGPHGALLIWPNDVQPNTEQENPS